MVDVYQVIVKNAVWVPKQNHYRVLCTICVGSRMNDHLKRVEERSRMYYRSVRKELVRCVPKDVIFIHITLFLFADM